MVALFPLPSPVGRSDEPDAPLFVVLFFALFFFEHVKTAKYIAGETQRENCRKTMAKVRGKKWDFRRWLRYREQMGFRSARMTMTLIAYFVRRHRVISGIRRWFMYHGDVTEFGARHKHAKCRCFIGHNGTGCIVMIYWINSRHLRRMSHTRVTCRKVDVLIRDVAASRDRIRYGMTRRIINLNGSFCPRDIDSHHFTFERYSGKFNEIYAIN